MTGSQDIAARNSQEIQTMNASIRNSVSPLSPLEKTISPKTPSVRHKRKQLLEQARNSPSAAGRIRAMRMLREQVSDHL